MSVSVTGQVKRIEIGTGTWALIADNGQTYELMEPPAELTQKKAKNGILPPVSLLFLLAGINLHLFI